MKIKALKAAFPHTIPILFGFGFLGFTYGIYMSVSGFAFWYSLLLGILIFGGSLQFVAVSVLLAPFAPVQTLAMAIMIQARHLFYGISMLEKYKGLGPKKIYLIFGLCDETFSINYTANVPKDIDRGWFYFFTTLLDQTYWVAASTLGGLFGTLITFDIKGLDFVMTAMFVVIFLEQWLKDKTHYSALLGLAAAIACRLGFGADSFLIPTMICMLIGLIFLKNPIERGEKA